MSIHLITGLPGAGKSAFGYVQAGDHARFDTRQVLSTYDMDWYAVRTAQWAEMMQAKQAVCVCDEMADIFHSRTYNKGEQVGQLNHFREHRKDGLTLYLIVQDYAMLDADIRRLALFVWEVRRLFGPDKYENPSGIEKRFGIHCRARQYRAASFDTPSKRVCLQTKAFRLDNLFGRFDTLAKSAGRYNTQQVRGVGLAATRLTRHEATRRGALRPLVPMTLHSGVGLTREEYYKMRTAVDPDGSYCRWGGGNFLELAEQEKAA